MENNQEFGKLYGDLYREAYADVSYFEVTYLDTDSGRVRTEIFDDATHAERFAGRRVADEDGWATIDAVPLQQGRAAA